MPPFGLWPSALTPRQMAITPRLNDVQWDSDGRTLVWLEMRDGRGALWAYEPASGEAPRELTPGDLAVRARLGYGGGDFTVSAGQVIFAEASTGRLFGQPLTGGPPRPLTPAFGAAAAPTLAPAGHHLLFVHSYEDQDCIAVVDAAGRHWPQRLAVGHDFYMWPCWHPDGAQVAFVAWDHPNMPWDGALLYLADLDRSGALPTLRGARVIAGGPHISIFQPCFAPDGRHLAYVSDHDGWWQVYLHDLGSGAQRQLTEGAAEHGEAAWAYGLRMLSWGHDGKQLYYLRNEGAQRQIYRQPVDGGAAQEIADRAGYSWFSQLAAAPSGDTLAMIASAPNLTPRLILADGAHTRIIRRSTGELLAPEQLATALPVSWRVDAASVYGLLYLPPGYVPGGAGPRPPAVVLIHGGPTGQAGASYNGEVQFLATRGYAVLEVNYRGSTGYGRAYAQALRGAWGVLDVADVAGAARYLAEAGIADPARLVIMGGSAGGYTVFETLAQHPQLFQAGICRYGVANLFTLAADTHKFEAHYLDALIGPLPAAAARYRERSPIFHAERINTPMAIFQGADDQVVPPAQSEAMVAALRRRNVPHHYQLFAGEGHGWRRVETITAYYQAIERFLREHVVFG